MTEYDIKRGNHKIIEGRRLGELLCDIFGKENVRGGDEENKFSVSYGAIDSMVTWASTKSILNVEITMNPDVEIQLGLDSRKKYNMFLDKATGFNSKKRRDRLKAKVKKQQV